MDKLRGSTYRFRIVSEAQLGTGSHSSGPWEPMHLAPQMPEIDIERRVVVGRYLLPVDTSSAGRRLRQHALQTFQVAPSDSSGTAGKTNGDVGRFHSVLVLEDGPKRCPSTPATPSGRCLAVFLSIIDPSLTSQVVALPTAPRHARSPPVS